MPHCVLLAVLLAVPAALSQPFQVTVVAKSASHPYQGQGNGNTFAIGGEQAAELTLVRGQTYAFQMVGTPNSHPFYISTSSSGGGAGLWSTGVTGTGATGTATLTFTVPASAPALLWYQCQNHEFMGWKLTIVSATGTEDEALGYAFDALTANPTSGGARFSLAVPTTGHVRVDVFAADGRRVAVLLDGVAAGGRRQSVTLGDGLASGVYVIRASAGDWRAERRVTVLR